MSVHKWLTSATVVAGTLTAIPVPAAEAGSEAAVRPAFSFGTLKATTPEAAKAKLTAWLRGIGRLDAAKLDAVWSQEGRSVSDRTLDSIILGLPDVAGLIATARDLSAPAPLEVPAILHDPRLDPFIRANLAAAYAKALAGRRIYEESLTAMKGVPTELLVDPAGFYFYKAVTEHALMQREQAIASISRLLDDVTDAPDRYRVTATLLFFDLQNWAKDPKDLSNIEKLMDNSGRRLDLARPGSHTQDIQKKIVFRLDEKIKQLEQQAKQQQQQANGGQCPSGGQKPGSSGSNTPNGPMQDSNIATNGGKGVVDEKKLRNYEKVWGTLPEAERTKVVLEMTRDLPPKYKPMIEDYFRSLNRLNGFSK